MSFRNRPQTPTEGLKKKWELIMCCKNMADCLLTITEWGKACSLKDEPTEVQEKWHKESGLEKNMPQSALSSLS